MELSGGDFGERGRETRAAQHLVQAGGRSGLGAGLLRRARVLPHQDLSDLSDPVCQTWACSCPTPGGGLPPPQVPSWCSPGPGPLEVQGGLSLGGGPPAAPLESPPRPPQIRGQVKDAFIPGSLSAWLHSGSTATVWTPSFHQVTVKACFLARVHLHAQLPPRTLSAGETMPAAQLFRFQLQGHIGLAVLSDNSPTRRQGLGYLLFSFVTWVLCLDLCLL